MRFIRGVFSFVAAAMFSVGTASFVVSFFGEEFRYLRTGGFFLLVLSVGINLLFTIPQPKGYKKKAFGYFLANGFIIFLYLTIIGIPIAKMISNTLPLSFDFWKAGNLSKYSHDLLKDKEYAIMQYLSLSEFLD